MGGRGLEPGTTLAGYRIDRELGHGGMGVVYAAEHVALGRSVAVKVVAPDLAADASFRERFLREAQLAAALEHPAIIPIYDAGEANGVLYLAMRRVEGGDLAAELAARGPLDSGRVVHLIAPVAGALDVAHRRHLVHRDVKPQNILIEPASAGEPERVFLTDFGLTKRTDESAGLTRTGMFVGTFRYAAPEQFQGRAVDGRTDQYSLACVVYECLAGAPPYPGNSDAEMMFGHLWLPPPQPSLRRSDLGPDVDRVLARALGKTPEERFPTCGEFLRELDAAVRDRAGRTAVAPPPPAPVAPTRTMTPPPVPTVAGRPPPASVASPPVPWVPPAGPVAVAPIVARRRRGLAAALVGAGALVSAASAAIISEGNGAVALLFVLPPAALAVGLYAAHRRGLRIALGVLALLDGAFAVVVGIGAALNGSPEAIPLIPGGLLVVLGGIRALVRAPSRPPPPPGGIPAYP